MLDSVVESLGSLALSDKLLLAELPDDVLLGILMQVDVEDILVFSSVRVAYRQHRVQYTRFTHVIRRHALKRVRSSENTQYGFINTTVFANTYLDQISLGI